MARSLDVRIEIRDSLTQPSAWPPLSPGPGFILRVPADLRLDDLHQAIQTVMEWQDRHPYVFEVADREFGPRLDQDDDQEDQEPDAWAGEARTVTVAQAFAQAKSGFDYIYNFRDEARVRVTHVAVHDALIRTVTCISGADADGVNRRLRAAFREQASPQFPAGPDAPPDRQLLAQLTLAVLSLGSRPTRRGVREASKTLRVEILEGLEEAGLIETAPDRKSVALTDAGVAHATALLAQIKKL
ncbi:MAG TPA: hypothetical protein VNJ02_11055 [Vicinamibacterales bacterium]|nr:hypothetical protein [Vicinamibacterales bacterium]